MNLNHDAQGFLVGEGAVQATPEEAKNLSQIASDIRAIKRHLLADDAGKTGQKAFVAIATPGDRRTGATAGLVGAPGKKASQAAQTPVATPKVRAGDGVKITAAVNRLTATQKQNGRTGDSVVATPRIQRDGRGRFVAAEAVTTKGLGGKVCDRDGRGRFTGVESADDGQERGLGKAMGALGDKLGELATATGDAGEVDPSIKAASEVSDLAGRALTGVKTVGSAAMAIAKPMGRGMAGLVGGRPSDAPTPWFRRFLGEMRLFRREQSAYSKAEIRLLKDIEAKPDGDGNGGGITGLLGMLGGALAGFLSLMVSGIGAAFTAGLSMVSMAGAAKLLKRVPVLGALLAAVGMGAEVYDSESDASLSRAEKDKKTGKAVGGGVGTIGGLLAGGAGGAKLGGMLGAIGGPLGIAVGASLGGLVGAVAGGFFGEKAGDIVGEKVGGWITDIRNADIPGMIGRTWDKTTSAVLNAWVDSTDWVGKKWDAALTGFSDIWAGAKAAFADFATGINALFAKFGIDLPAIKEKMAAAAEAAKTAAANAVATAKTAVETGAKAVSEKAGQAKEAFDQSMVGKGIAHLFSGGKEKAVETAQAYSAGNIAGLDDAHTRALVASTTLTESSGGKLDARNMGGRGVDGKGYVGRYQAGAGWLAGAGLIKGGSAAVQEAMKADGIADPTKRGSEWKWAQAGGMDKFLKNDANWNKGLSLQKYMSSAEVQDAAFKTNNDKNYASLVKRNVIKEGDSQEKIAGLLKAAHLAGIGGAVEVSKGRTGASDANKTSAKKYFDDVAKDKDGFVGAFKQAEAAKAIAQPQLPVASTAMVAVSAPPSVVRVPQVSLPTIPRLDLPDGGSTPPPMFNQPPPQPIVVQAPRELAGRDLPNRKIAHIQTGGISN